MNCEQVEELLSAYLDDQLTEHIYSAVTTHLEECRRCYAFLTSYRRYDALLAQLPRVEPPPYLRTMLFSSPRYRRRHATATAIISSTIASTGREDPGTSTYRQHDNDPRNDESPPTTLLRSRSLLLYIPPILLIILLLLSYLLNLHRFKPQNNAQ
jgi:Predicted integral membrane protein